MKKLAVIPALLALSLALFSQTAFAQDTSSVPVTAPPTGAAATPQNLVGFLLPNAQQLAQLKAACAACKEKICSCCVGQLLGSMTMPLSMMTGGCIKPCCPPVPASALKQPADSAAGACARITKDQLEMEERRKAVRCLARVDCNWYPEAELALINSLRTDRAECVRLEAAKVLSIGCCGTKKVIDALTICVNASSKDGNPPENSPRVREMALVALQHALECYVEREEPQRPEAPGNLPAPKPLPEKPAPEKTLPEKTALRDKAAAMDDPTGVIAAAIKTLRQGQVGKEEASEVPVGQVTQTKLVTEAKVESQPVRAAVIPQKAQADSDSSEAVLSRAMLAIRKSKTAVPPGNRESGRVLAKGQRSVLGIFSNALKPPAKQQTAELPGQEIAQTALKGSDAPTSDSGSRTVRE